MSAINAHNNRDFSIRINHARRRNLAAKAIPMPFNSSGLELAGVSATMVFGYLLALVSAAVVLLTGQPPWFLLTAVVAFAIAQFLPRGLDKTGTEQR